MNMSRKLLILDLDETLIHATKTPLDRAVDFQVGRYSVYKRPHVDHFLRGCHQWFEVAVWTSASPDYAAEVVAHLFREPPVFLWAGDRCSPVFDYYRGERVMVKTLAKLRRRGYRLEQVLVVDDSPEKHVRNYGNLIAVHPFTGDPEDRELLLLLTYLETLRDVDNVRRIEKRHWRKSPPSS
jgi:RNA polymerase II subunit A small phosphatase-like protein